VLVHNGYFFVSDIMKHLQRTNTTRNEYGFEMVVSTDLKTDPKLEPAQMEELLREIERMTFLYEKLMKTNPLEFSASPAQ